MPYVDHRGWSSFITGRQARELHAASTFAGVIARPLLHRVHINWTRTALEDDFDGAALASYRARLARWLRHPAPEKLEIIRLVEQSHLTVRATLDKLGITRSTFYRWYDAYSRGGPEALVDRPSQPSRVWNRLPVEVREQIVTLALEHRQLPRS